MIDGVPLDRIGLPGLLSVFVMLVFFGGLVPRWIFNRIIQDKDELIDRLTKALDKRDEQFDKLFQQGELTVKLLEDLKAASQAREVRQ